MYFPPGDLPADAVKFVTVNGGSGAIYPCDAADKNMFFVKSGHGKHFFTDITEVLWRLLACLSASCS
jgi:hypothetical protein